MEELNIKITKKELLELLSKKLKVPSSEKLAKLIIETIQHEHGLTALYRGLMDIFPVLNYKVGDPIYVEAAYLASWRMDKDATVALPGILNEKYVPCIITNCSEYRQNPYTVIYTYIQKDTANLVEDTYELPESLIYKRNETFADTLNALENHIIENSLNLTRTNNLPF